MRIKLDVDINIDDMPMFLEDWGDGEKIEEDYASDEIEEMLEEAVIEIAQQYLNVPGCTVTI